MTISSGRPISEPDSRQLLSIMQNGGVFTVAHFQKIFPLSRYSILRRLGQLERQEEIVQISKGSYQAPIESLSIPDAVKGILDDLDAFALEAHVTGLDILIPYTHQFIKHYPHIVYVDPLHLDAAEDALASDQHIIVRLNAATRIPMVDNPSDVILLRKQSNSAQYGCHGMLAPPEKAWVDTLRETHRGHIKIEFMELGRILHNLIDSGADLKKLKNYARRMGYLDWIQYASGELVAQRAPAFQALKAGYDS